MGQRICFINLTPPFLGRRYGWKIAVGMIIDALERLVVDNKETFKPGNTGLIFLIMENGKTSVSVVRM